jgi:pimeloyl-ACP methyl ester carboxylesterase
MQNNAPKPTISICILFLSFAVPLFLSAQDNKKADYQIDEEKYVLINGIEQWITIKGEITKPIILFLHGGPGSPISPYSETLYKEWQKDFIIVQWDQRGTGKTFGRNAPAELTPGYLQLHPLTVKQMSADGIEVSEYLIKHCQKQKIILFGTSWGSVLGVKMATERPDLFFAYVGHSQVVTPLVDSILYNRVYQIAKVKNDKAALETLNSIGKPPYDRARSTGQLFRIVKKYETENSIAAPDSWFVVSVKYDNTKDNQDRSDGDDYSFVNFVGDKILGVQPMSKSIDIMKDNLIFKIPIYLIQGDEDLLTPKEVTKKYFNNIKAPKKEYFLLPKTAHGFNLSVLEMQYKIFKAVKIYHGIN